MEHVISDECLDSIRRECVEAGTPPHKIHSRVLKAENRLLDLEFGIGDDESLDLCNLPGRRKVRLTRGGAEVTDWRAALDDRMAMVIDDLMEMCVL